MRDVFLLEAAHPVLRDHTVHGRHVLPGLAYIDLVYQLFRANGHDPTTLELRNLKIYQPLTVEPGGAAQLELEAVPTTPHAWRITVHSSGTRCATADMYEAGRPVYDERLNREHLRAAEQSAVERDTIDRGTIERDAVDRIYDRLVAQQLVHGAFMRPRGVIHRTSDAAWCDLQVSAEALTHASRLLFHPALLDAAAVCAGAATALPQEARDPRLLLPLSYASFRAASLLQRAVIARVRFDSVRQNADIKQFTIDFFDTKGRKVAELRDLACKAVRDPRALSPVSFPTASGTPAIERLLREAIAARLRRPVEEVGVDEGYYEMGLDSAALLDLAREIEQALGVTLPPTLLFEHTTIAALTRHLTRGGHEPRVSGTRAAATLASATLASTASAAVAARSTAPTSASDNRAVAIVAVAGRYPQAPDIERYWENLRDGIDCVREIPPDRWDHRAWFDPGRTRPDGSTGKWGGFIDDVDRFDARFFDIAPGEAALIDPQQRLLLETVWTLLEQAGYTRRRLHTDYASSVGVFVGAMYQHYAALETDPARAAIMSLSSYGAIANRISWWFGLTGPSLAIDTMCSSSLVAVHLACQALTRGDCRMAIAGGVNLSIHPWKYVGLSQRQLLGSDPERRSFADGDGFIPAEAVGAVLLKPLDAAIADGDPVFGVILATASNHGGRSGGFAVPNVGAQRDVIAEALTRARVDARSISYVEAAANGSALGDAAELAALGQAFDAHTADRQFCAIGSAKATIGHAEAASGIAQLTKVLMQLRHGEIAPQRKADPPNPHVSFERSPFFLPRVRTPWPRVSGAVDGEAMKGETVKGETVNGEGVDVATRDRPRRALVNSFGAGGSNVTLVIEEQIAASAGAPTDPTGPTNPMGLSAGEPQVIVCSAKTAERLRAVARQLAAHLAAHVELSLAEVAYTLQVGREHMPARLAFVASSREVLIERLARHAEAAGSEMASGRPKRTEIQELISGKAGDALVRALLSERDLERLAHLWSRGVDVPWELLHDGRRHPIVALPTYPFDRQRYWSGEQAAVPAPTPPPALEPAQLNDDRPRTELERAIAAVWEEVLGVGDIGLRDTFLDLGGSSLTGGQIIVRLRVLFGVEIPVRAFIGPHATIAALVVEIVTALARQQDAASLEQHFQAVAQS